MSVSSVQNLRRRNVNFLWFLFILFYLAICFGMSVYITNLKRTTHEKIDAIKAMQAVKLKKNSAPKGFKEKEPEYKKESLYSQSGSINPLLMQKEEQDESKRTITTERAYQQQLSEYKLKMAEQRQRQLEALRKQREEAARQQALLDMQSAVSEQEQQEVQEAVIVEEEEEEEYAGDTDLPQTPQDMQPKTKIGTLRTSKLGQGKFSD